MAKRAAKEFRPKSDIVSPQANKPLQRAAIKAGPAPEPPASVQETLNSTGQPLDNTTRQFMETRFSHDFSGVRVHTDAKAAESAEAVNALAYTTGQQVVFGAGQYAPETSAGKKLLAHELSHVVQQSTQAAPAPQNLRIGEAGNQLEQAADRSAAQVVAGDRLAAPYSRGRVGPIIQRQPKPELDAGRFNLAGLNLGGVEIAADEAELASDETPSTQNPKLVKLADSFQKMLAASSGANIKISSYIDEDLQYDSKKANAERSRQNQRMNSTKTALITLGIPADKIETNYPIFGRKMGGVIEVRAYKGASATPPLLIPDPKPPVPKPTPGPGTTPATTPADSSSGLNLPDFSKYTKFSIKILGNARLDFDLPSSVVATLPIKAGNGKMVVMDFTAEASGTLTFSIKLQGLPGVELGGKASVDLGGDQPKGKFEVGATATHQVCRADTAESIKAKMDSTGKELVEAVGKLKQAIANNKDTPETMKEELKQAVEVGKKIKELYDLREKAQEACKPVPLGSLKLTGESTLGPSKNEPIKPADLTKPEPLGNTIMLVFELKL